MRAQQQTNVGGETDPNTDGGYQLVCSNEFDNEGALNPKNWTSEKGFVRNHEAQLYQQENAEC